MVVGAILMVVPLFTAPKFEFLGACQIIGLVLFFLGMAVYYILKMCEVKKLGTSIAILTTGLLATIVLVVGSFGFIYKENKTDATKTTYSQGVFGNAYAQANYSVKEARKDGSIAFVNALAKADIKKSTKITDLKIADLKKIQAEAKKFVDKNKNNKDYDLTEANGLISVGDTDAALTAFLPTFQTELVSGVTAAKTALNHKAPTADEIKAFTWGDALKAEKALYKVYQTQSLVILFTYISLILVMGLVPTVVGAKKLVCALGKCECCGKEPVKATSAPVAYSAPVAPVAPVSAPKAPTTRK